MGEVTSKVCSAQTGPADTRTGTLPLRHGVPFDALDLGTVIVQAHRVYPGSGSVQTYGARATLAELKLSESLPLRPLTPEDIPLEVWTEHLAQYSVREDGGLVTNQALVVWGKIRAEGGITWFVETNLGAGIGSHAG